MKVLITGGAGFIGSNLSRYFLERGFEVAVLDNLSTGFRENLPNHPKFQFIEGDIRDEEILISALSGCDRICHLAAAVGNVRSIEKTVEDSEINVLGTLNVLEAARKNKINKIVYSSSAAIFGEPQKLPMDEEHPFSPDSPYGVSKLAGELQARCFAKLYGMDIICLRYFNVYGPNQRCDAYGNVIPIFSTQKIRGKPMIIYGDGEQTRDFVHVEDIAQANFLGATRPNVGGTYNIGSGYAITINELTKLFNETTGGKPVPVEYISPRKGEVKHSLAKIEKAKKVLGYSPKYTIHIGLKGYWQWITANVS